MQNVIVGRYADPESVGFAGWIEPEDRRWIVFVDLAGDPVLFAQRDPTGAVE